MNKKTTQSLKNEIMKLRGEITVLKCAKANTENNLEVSRRRFSEETELTCGLNKMILELRTERDTAQIALKKRTEELEEAKKYLSSYRESYGVTNRELHQLKMDFKTALSIHNFINRFKCRIGIHSMESKREEFLSSNNNPFQIYWQECRRCGCTGKVDILTHTEI
jgi:chromosome segregation ATPase